MPPKTKRVAVKPRDAAKMPRNPAEDALEHLTLARDLFEEQVLARLDPTERGMLRLVNKDLRSAVQHSPLRWALMVPAFVESVERFEWALKHKIFESSHWCLRINNAIIEGGNLDVLKRAELVPGFEFTLQEMLTSAGLGHTQIFEWLMAVSYTHLTLPTILRV